MLEWLLTVTAPWSSDLRQVMSSIAANFSRLAVTQWLTAKGAVWPEAFSVECGFDGDTQKICWSIAAVQWALSCGSGWLAWKF
jgi:hypothetical protein